MKKFCLVIALFSFISLGAEAQDRRKSRERMTPEKIAERITERMAQELDLSEEQKKEVYALHLKNATKRAEEMKAQWEKMKADHQAHQERLDDILSPDQKAKWEAQKKELWEKRRIPREGKEKFDRKKRKQRLPAEDVE